MTNDELDQLLKKARVPERKQEYWEEFPKAVTRQLHSRSAKESRPERSLKRDFTFFGIGLATACLVISLAISLWPDKKSAVKISKTKTGETDLAAVQAYFREIEALFPNQVRAVVFDDKGPHLILSDHADVPTSSPLFVKVCGGRSCQSFLTFSGQQISANGEAFEVLSGSGGEIILMGKNTIWSSTHPTKTSLYIDAKELSL